MEEQSKKVDESYKEKVGKEKGNAESASSKPQDSRAAEDFSVPEASISFFITTLAMQAHIALGDVADPQTKQSQENLPQAKFLIDTLGVLEEKTKGNLTKEEASLLEGFLYELRMQFVQKTGGQK